MFLHSSHIKFTNKSQVKFISFRPLSKINKLIKNKLEYISLIKI